MEIHSVRGKLLLTLTLIMIGLTFLLGAILLPERIRTEKEVRVERISMMAELLGEDKEVKESIQSGEAKESLQKRFEKLTDEYGIDFIVLAQKDGIRVYHPDSSKIGKKFVGGDEKNILKGAKPYVSIAKGSVNTQERAFYGIKINGEIEGFVMVSMSLTSIREHEIKLIFQLLFVVLIVFAIGFVVFEYIAKSMQKTLLGYEPEELANIYLQGEQALRASTHEFVNQMHVVSGLLQIEEYEEAITYIGGITYELEDNQGTIVHNIKNPTISALLLGKSSRAKELGIQFSVRKDSQLRRHTPYLSSNDMVTIIGNLVENAFDALKNKEGMRQIEVFIGDSEDGLIITVDDTGDGLTKEQIKILQKKAFTTKGKGHGTGLRLIRGIVQRQRGYLEIESEIGEGSSFSVSFDQKRKEYS